MRFTNKSFSCLSYMQRISLPSSRRDPPREKHEGYSVHTFSTWHCVIRFATSARQFLWLSKWLRVTSSFSDDEPIAQEIFSNYEIFCVAFSARSNLMLLTNLCIYYINWQMTTAVASVSQIELSCVSTIINIATWSNETELSDKRAFVTRRSRLSIRGTRFLIKEVG